MIQSSRAQGIVSGRLAQDLVMDYIPQDESVAVGDVILTSGMGGNYPKALVIGQVVEVAAAKTSRPFSARSCILR